MKIYESQIRDFLAQILSTVFEEPDRMLKGGERMNATNIPLMSWISQNNSSAPSGLQQGLTGSVTTDPDGSVFQQLIAQMTAMRNTAPAEQQTETLQAGSFGLPAENGALMELLFFAKNPIGQGLKNTDVESGLTGTIGNDTEQVPIEENSELELMQALMLGLPAAGTSATGVPVNPQMQNGVANAVAAGISGNPGTSLNSTGFEEVQELVFRPDTRFDQKDQTTVTQTGLGQTGSDGEAAFGTVLGGSSVYSGIEGGKGVKSGQDILTSLEKAQPAGGILPEAEPQMKGSETGNPERSAITKETAGTGQFQLETHAANPKEYGAGLSQKLTEGKSVSGDEVKGDGAIQNTAAQDCLNTVHADPVKESGSLDQSTQASGKAEAYSQISSEILSRLERKSSSEFRMQLEPEDLGQIDIKLKLSDGKLIIDILAASSKTQSLLTNQVDKLIASMGLQNVQVESVQVGQQMSQQSHDGQNQWQGMNFGMDFSQRRNQEQLQKDLFNGGSPGGSGSASQSEAQEVGSADLTGSMDLRRYNLHRMNYTI